LGAVFEEFLGNFLAARTDGQLARANIARNTENQAKSRLGEGVIVENAVIEVEKVRNRANDLVLTVFARNLGV
jgi:hypothetical protein